MGGFDMGGGGVQEMQTFDDKKKGAWYERRRGCRRANASFV